MNKPTVLYDYTLSPIKVGKPVIVKGTVGHPLLKNDGGMTRTSTVVEVIDGGFETLNSIYRQKED